MSNMIPGLENYFKQIIPPRDNLLLEMEKEAIRENIPIIGPVVGELLHILARSMNAGRILELGTATGYSTVYLARALNTKTGKLITLEHNEVMADRAYNNFHKAGLNNCIEVQVGDAVQIMESMLDQFDFILLDIEKEDYLTVLSHCQRLLRSGGLMVTDNVGFQGAENFNRAIVNSSAWKSVHLLAAVLPIHSPEKDGICIAMRT